MSTGTTVHHWVATAQGRVVVALAIAVMALLATTAVLVHRGGTKGARARTTASATLVGIDAAVGWRAKAARWAVSELDKGTTVACDQSMCQELARLGTPIGSLLRIDGPDTVLQSDVVIVTAQVRGALGNQLNVLLARDILARFGTGASRFEVREVAADGRAAHRARQSADKRDRAFAGRALLDNRRLGVTPDVARQLSDGDVDGRLLTVLALLGSQHRLYLRSFGDAGGSLDVPLRSVDIATLDGKPPGSGAATGIGLLLHGQEARFRPAETAIVTADEGGTPVLRVRYGAPSPLGLLTP